MASLQVSSMLSSFSSSSSEIVIKSSFNVPKLPKVLSIAPNIRPSRKLIEELNGQLKHTIPIMIQENDYHYSPKYNSPSSKSPKTKTKTITQLYAILESVSDRIEMHQNIGEQRDNWNTLLLNSINMITLTATAMAGISAISGSGAPLLALKLSSALLFSASTGMLIIMNKIQPSQLAEEQRNATRLFKQLKSQIETTIAIGNPTEEYIKDTIQEVLALDRAYPLPLLGVMIEKFPQKYEPANWRPTKKSSRRSNNSFHSENNETKKNGWNEGLESEVKDVLEVMKRKDMEDYERLGNLVLKINKTLAIAGPLLTGIAAVGSTFVGQGSLASIVPVMAGALATAVNSFEHGGQVGMVSEMYRACGGFFQMMESSIQENILEEDEEQRENGDLFEIKLALKLGRSLSQLRDLARKSAYSRVEGTTVDEFASKLF
ncbi:putative petal formation-expressed [Medicago truncatula]|uniref:F-box plant-like protein, putative n=1 Tax=Medicago truncatula TaxID=3880 RepID=A0A072V4I6_MEDTR|nr:probable F-box protein At4g22030 [Medicago truncatula]KEH36889.1 F-box plant-like protein, putative [Medicago truncatula]RHN72527.1 putative petal formation-expressed [Medicago truncatula]